MIRIIFLFLFWKYLQSFTLIRLIVTGLALKLSNSINNLSQKVKVLNNTLYSSLVKMYDALYKRTYNRGRHMQIRGAQNRSWNFVQVNPTSWTAAHEFLKVCGGDKCDFVAFQEVSRSSFSAPTAEAQGNRIGFHTRLHHSLSTEAGGLSAVVGLAARAAYAMKTVNYPITVDDPPPSRFILRHVSGLLKEG